MAAASLHDRCESIDASVFSGDLLFIDESRAELKQYAARWLRAIGEHEAGCVARTEPPIYVVVCQNDQAHPRWGVDKGGPVVLEQYTCIATLEHMRQRAAGLQGYGAIRVARLVFEDVDGSPL